MSFIVNRKFIKGTVTIPDSVYKKPVKHQFHMNITKIVRKRIYMRKQKYRRFRILYSYYKVKKYRKAFRRVSIRGLYRKYLQSLVGKNTNTKSEISYNLVKEQKIHNKVVFSVLLRDMLIREGNKVYAQNIVDLFCIFLKRYMPKIQPLLVLERVVLFLCPLFAVRTKKVAGQKLKVPLYLKVMRRYFLALRWLVESAEQRNDGATFSEKLAKECRDVYKLKGSALKKRLDLCKEVDDSRVNLRFVK